MIDRNQKLREKFLSNIDAALISNIKNRYYFTNFKSSEGFVIITKDKTLLYVDFRYIEAAKNEAQGCEVKLLENTKDAICDFVKEYGISTVAIENSITVQEYNVYKNFFKDNKVEVIENSKLDDTILEMRSIKDKDEICKIKYAQKITDSAFEHILPIIKQGNITEKEIALELEFFMKKKGAEALSFDMIIVSGKNTSLPHGVPSDKIIQAGDFITIDMGCVCNSYCSDMTRTIALQYATDEMKNIYNIVLKAQQAAISKIKNGVKCCDVDMAARDIIYSAGFRGCFGHGTGHGIGLEAHEGPRCNSNSNDILRSGMLTSVEPGIYLEDKYGVRIEDLVEITDNGCNNLTNTSKELLIL